MAQDWLQAMYTNSKADYVNGQLEKGKEGTIHLQFYVHLPESKKCRKTAMIKLCKYSSWTPVNKDNGASDYCLKEESRLEGPWEFGIKPLRQNVKGECKEARAAKNAILLEKDIDTLVADGEISLLHVPVLKRAKDIVQAIKN